jgi:hypothetical protein
MTAFRKTLGCKRASQTQLGSRELRTEFASASAFPIGSLCAQAVM